MTRKRLTRLPPDFDVEGFVSQLPDRSVYTHTPEIPRGCKWIYGDFKSKKGGRYCAKNTIPGKSWCRKHFRKVFPYSPLTLKMIAEKEAKEKPRRFRVRLKGENYHV